MSNISSIYIPAFVAKVILIINPAIHIIVTTFFLVHPVLSIIGAETASTKDTVDVSPANVKHVKNKTANIFPQVPIILNTCGNTTKARDIPFDTTSSTGTPSLNAIKPKIEKTPIAHKNSNPQFAKLVIKALLLISDFFGR